MKLNFGCLSYSEPTEAECDPNKASKGARQELYSFFESKHKNLLDEIRTNKQIPEELAENVRKALDELKTQLGELT